MEKKFVVIPGGKGIEGPISRMGLWDHFQPLPRTKIFLILGFKVILLGMILYYFPF